MNNRIAATPKGKAKDVWINRPHEKFGFPTYRIDIVCPRDESSELINQLSTNLDSYYLETLKRHDSRRYKSVVKEELPVYEENGYVFPLRLNAQEVNRVTGSTRPNTLDLFDSHEQYITKGEQGRIFEGDEVRGFFEIRQWALPFSVMRGRERVLHLRVGISCKLRGLRVFSPSDRPQFDIKQVGTV